MSEAKMRYCWNCGAQLGLLTRAEWMPSDTCGARDCERAARDADRLEREEAHYELDRDRGWL